MVKTIYLDSKANHLLNNLIQNEHESKTGLLIGTIDASKDYITLVIPTPKNEEDCSDKTGASWALNHALLIHDMLVGGCDILGVYTIDQTPIYSRSLLAKIFKSLNEIDYYREMKFNKERLLFLVDTQRKSINMKCLDVSLTDNKNYQACEIKVIEDLLENQFTNLGTNFNLKSIFKILNVHSYDILKEDFMKALPVNEYFMEEKFLCLIDDELFDDYKQFSEIAKLIQGEKNEYSVSLIENLNSEFVNSKQNVCSSNFNESIYELAGDCSLLISFPNSFKLKYIKKLFIYDLIRSFNARIRLLVEDLDASKDIIGDVQLEEPNSNDPSSIEESYQTPNRIQICLNGRSSQMITDYMFPDETDSDIFERIKDLFGCDLIDASKQIVYLEDLPLLAEIKTVEAKDIGDNSSRKNSISSQISNQNEKKNEGLNKNFSFVSIVVLLVSLIIAFWIYINNFSKST